MMPSSVSGKVRAPMFKQLAHPATVISMLALLVATAGGSFAAGALIGSPQIADHSIQLRDLSPAAVAALHGRTGAAGPAGANGTFEPSKLSRVQGADVTVPGQSFQLATVTCPAGQSAIAGGGDSQGVGITASVPVVAGGVGAPTGWAINVFNYLTAPVTIHAFAVCASP
jgi:hypothetical protein